MSPRLLVALNGSPVRGSSIDRLLEAAGEGARTAGGEFEHIRCNELIVKPCQACGPEPTTGYCVYHDDMDGVFASLERAHAVIVGSPIYFDTVSAQLKLVMDRCNCITPLVVLPDGSDTFRPKWRRTRRGAFVTACGAHRRYELAERSVRGFLKWIGAKWEETLAWMHEDNDVGSVAQDSERMAKARALGVRLITSDPLEE